MQYIKELSDGTRKQVSEDQYITDRMGPDKAKFVPILNVAGACIYHTNGTTYAPASPQALRYGGRAKRQAMGFHA